MDYEIFFKTGRRDSHLHHNQTSKLQPHHNFNQIYENSYIISISTTSTLHLVVVFLALYTLFYRSARVTRAVMEDDAMDLDIIPIVVTMYDDQEVCRYLLRSLDTSVALQLLPSNIHLGGTGLFAKDAIPAQSDIFRSTPLVRCLNDGKTGTLCDYCYVSITGLVTIDVDPDPGGYVTFKTPLCKFCGSCGYCSDVRILDCAASITRN